MKNEAPSITMTAKIKFSVLFLVELFFLKLIDKLMKKPLKKYVLESYITTKQKGYTIVVKHWFLYFKKAL